MVSHETGATQTTTTDPRLVRTDAEMRELVQRLIDSAPLPPFPHESH